MEETPNPNRARFGIAEHVRRHQVQLEAVQAKLTPGDASRAMAAFNRVLAAAGFDVMRAVDAATRHQHWDHAGFPEDDPDVPYSDEDHAAATALSEAVEAGRAELCDRAPFLSEDEYGVVSFVEAAHDPLALHSPYRWLSLQQLMQQDAAAWPWAAVSSPTPTKSGVCPAMDIAAWIDACTARLAEVAQGDGVGLDDLRELAGDMSENPRYNKLTPSAAAELHAKDVA